MTVTPHRLVAAGKWTEFVAYNKPGTIESVLKHLLQIRGDSVKVRGHQNVLNGCANRWRFTVPGEIPPTPDDKYFRNQLDYIWKKDFSYLGVNAITIPADALNFQDAVLPESTKEEIDLAKKTCPICKQKFKEAFMRGSHIFKGHYGATSACIAYGKSLREGDDY